MSRPPGQLQQAKISGCVKAENDGCVANNTPLSPQESGKGQYGAIFYYAMKYALRTQHLAVLIESPSLVDLIPEATNKCEP